MTYQIGDNAFAVKTADEWILKPICDSGVLGTGINGFAVWAGGEWMLTPAAKAGVGDNAVTVRDAGNDPVLMPLGCPGEGCVGQDSRCSNCDCSAKLKNTYTITFSGFPDICMADEFNGSWQVTWDEDCYWTANIGGARYVSISLESTWAVSFYDAMPGGPSGSFYCSASEDCHPDNATWVPTIINQPFGCDGLADEWLDNATCVVS